MGIGRFNEHNFVIFEFYLSLIFFRNNEQTSGKTTKEEDKTKGFSVPFVKALMPNYFSSEWSFAQFHLSESHAIVCFSQDNQIIGTNGDIVSNFLSRLQEWNVLQILI